MTGIKQFDPQEVLDKATVLFQCKGFTATSMQDIVGTLGISRGSLYDTFGNKQALYIAALKNYHHQQFQQMKQLLEEAPTAKSGIKTLLGHIAGMSQGTNGRLGCLIGNTIIERAIHDKESEDIATNAVTQNIRLLTETLQRAQQEGDFPKERDPEQAARLLQTNMQGLVLMGVALPSIATLQQIADDMFNSLFQ